MRKILLIGAGKSTSALIKYLKEKSNEEKLQLIIGDLSLANAEKFAGDHPNTKAIELDIFKADQRQEAIKNADIVISMLPARFHIEVAKDCVNFNKNLVTASYVSDEMQALDEEVKQKGLTFMNEIGVDPGIDHMSAMQVIDRIRAKGGKMLLFESFTGGLVAPESDTNLWNYKFTWNPRNVVLAGQGTAQYIKQGKYKYIPYAKLFERTEKMSILDAGEFEGYANRDSLSYRKAYGLEKIPTLFRGTLRRKGFCKSWNMFVQLGMTEDTYVVENTENMTYREFTNLFFPFNNKCTVEQKFCDYLNISVDSVEFKKVKWLGIFIDKKVGIIDATPAKILQKILEEKWSLEPKDKDMIVMQHQFEYLQNGELKKLNSSLLVFGEDTRYTAMAKTVGLPVAIATKLILNGAIQSTGVKIPTAKDVYVPVLVELKEHGINFVEEEPNV